MKTYTRSAIYILTTSGSLGRFDPEYESDPLKETWARHGDSQVGGMRLKQRAWSFISVECSKAISNPAVCQRKLYHFKEVGCELTDPLFALPCESRSGHGALWNDRCCQRVLWLVPFEQIGLVVHVNCRNVHKVWHSRCHDPYILSFHIHLSILTMSPANMFA